MPGLKISAEEPGWRERTVGFAYRSRRRAATVLAIALAGLLAYHVIFGANGLTIYRQKRMEDSALQKEILQLQQQNGRLADHIQHLKTDPDAIEHEARMILHYARPGEIIYKLNDKPPSAAPNSAAAK